MMGQEVCRLPTSVCSPVSRAGVSGIRCSSGLVIRLFRLVPQSMGLAVSITGRHRGASCCSHTERITRLITFEVTAVSMDIGMGDDVAAYADRLIETLPEETDRFAQATRLRIVLTIAERLSIPDAPIREQLDAIRADS